MHADGNGGRSITEQGFRFLLMDTYNQLWTLLRQYLVDADRRSGVSTTQQYKMKQDDTALFALGIEMHPKDAAHRTEHCEIVQYVSMRFASTFVVPPTVMVQRSPSCGLPCIVHG